jgi:bacterioferritin
MDKAQIIELLRADMRGEHQAIIQYLNHAYSLEGTGVAPAIEAIAREEMRHLDWLADAITGLGGDPDMGREMPDLASASAPEQMQKNVALEQQAIDQYRQHLEVIDDAEIRRTLARIVHDEEVHRGAFEDLADKLLAAAAEAPAEATEGAGERLAEMLNYGVQHEYTVILQYLFHAFVAKNCEEREELQMAAINEMQHMGWLSEGLQEEGTQPTYEHHDLFLSRDPVANLEADVALEDARSRNCPWRTSRLSWHGCGITRSTTRMSFVRCWRRRAPVGARKLPRAPRIRPPSARPRARPVCRRGLPLFRPSVA